MVNCFSRLPTIDFGCEHSSISIEKITITLCIIYDEKLGRESEMKFTYEHYSSIGICAMLPVCKKQKNPF
jgi:hypothetical protein